MAGRTVDGVRVQLGFELGKARLGPSRLQSIL